MLGLPLDEVAIVSAVIVTSITLPLAYLAFKQAEVTMADVHLVVTDLEVINVTKRYWLRRLSSGGSGGGIRGAWRRLVPAYDVFWALRGVSFAYAGARRSASSVPTVPERARC